MSFSRQEREEMDRFSNEIGALRGDELLARKAAHDALPSPTDEEREMRTFGDLVFEAALIQEFGLGKWRKQLAAYLDRQKNG